jgi:hypothetical protein
MISEPWAGCSKSSSFSPAQPPRAGPRLSTGAAAASEEAKRTLFGTVSL